MTETSLRTRIRAGDVVMGVLTPYKDADQAEVLAMLGWDFIMFDGEHGSFGPSELGDLARAVQIRGGTALVRTPGREKHTVARFLESGVTGVMSPFIDDGDAALELVNSALYPPAGGRGVAGTRATDFGLKNGLAAAIEAINQDMILIAQIETPTAVGNIAAICEQSRIDVMFLGLADLSVTMGYPVQTRHPAVAGSVQTIINTASVSTARIGALITSPRQIKWALDQGITFLAVYADSVLADGSITFLSQLSELSKTQP